MSFEPRLDILPPQQRDLWPLLADVPPHCVLYGGTAIALRLGHRESVDFDFFSAEPLASDALLDWLATLGATTRIRQEPDTLICLIERIGLPVQIAFFGKLRFGRVGDVAATTDRVLRVAAALDLLGHKLKVILQRAQGRDYQDIAALLQHGAKLSQGLAAAAALFPGFPIAESVRALAYRDDMAEPHRLSAAAGALLDGAIRDLPPVIDPLPLRSMRLD